MQVPPLTSSALLPHEQDGGFIGKLGGLSCENECKVFNIVPTTE